MFENFALHNNHQFLDDPRHLCRRPTEEFFHGGGPSKGATTRTWDMASTSGGSQDSGVVVAGGSQAIAGGDGSGASRRYGYFITLAPVTSTSSDEEDDKSVYDSIHNRETDFCEDSDDYSTDASYSGVTLTADHREVVEFDVVTESSDDGEYLYMEDSYSGSDNYILDQQILVVPHPRRKRRAPVDLDVTSSTCSSSSGNATDDGTWTESTDDADPELRPADYWKCVKCNNSQNNPLYRFCEKCYQLRKNYFPPRPKLSKSRVRKKPAAHHHHHHHQEQSSSDCATTSGGEEDHDEEKKDARKNRRNGNRLRMSPKRFKDGTQAESSQTTAMATTETETATQSQSTVTTSQEDEKLVVRSSGGGCSSSSSFVVGRNLRGEVENANGNWNDNSGVARRSEEVQLSELDVEERDNNLVETRMDLEIRSRISNNKNSVLSSRKRNSSQMLMRTVATATTEEDTPDEEENDEEQKVKKAKMNENEQQREEEIGEKSSTTIAVRPKNLMLLNVMRENRLTDSGCSSSYSSGQESIPSPGDGCEGGEGTERENLIIQHSSCPLTMLDSQGRGSQGGGDELSLLEEDNKHSISLSRDFHVGEKASYSDSETYRRSSTKCVVNKGEANAIVRRMQGELLLGYSKTEDLEGRGRKEEGGGGGGENLRATKSLLEQYEEQKEEDRLNNLCIICVSEPKDSAFVHARSLHVCCCYKCALKVWNKKKRCPICNCKVKNVLKFFVH